MRKYEITPGTFADYNEDTNMIMFVNHYYIEEFLHKTNSVMIHMTPNETYIIVFPKSNMIYSPLFTTSANALSFINYIRDYMLFIEENLIGRTELIDSKYSEWQKSIKETVFS
jgi:hypothetical protein